MNTTIPQNARLITAEEAAMLIHTQGRFVSNGSIFRMEIVGAATPKLIVGTDLRLFALFKVGKTLYVCLTKDGAAKYMQIMRDTKAFNLLGERIAERCIVLNGSYDKADGHAGMQNVSDVLADTHIMCKRDYTKPGSVFADSDNMRDINNDLTAISEIDNNEFGHNPSIAHPSI